MPGRKLQKFVACTAVATVYWSNIAQEEDISFLNYRCQGVILLGLHRYCTSAVLRKVIKACHTNYHIFNTVDREFGKRK
jgi:hypothetical protein